MADRLIEIEKVLKALANRRRLTIIRFLQSKKSASVGEIASHIKLSFAATSRHLRQLAAASLVDSDQTNTTVNYSLSKDAELVQHLRLNRTT